MSALKIMMLVFFFGFFSLNTGHADTPLPFEAAIKALMDPLDYSGVAMLEEPQAGLAIDFNKRIWTLKNAHTYDNQGRIILAQGRYGLCAELATYMFEHIKPWLDGRYELQFAMATQADFFPSERTNHIVLLLVDRSNKQVYLIDPSFHQYGKLKELPQYKILNVRESLGFVDDQTRDVFFRVDQATPLYVKQDFLLTFSVTSVDGQFNKDNFIFVISANERGKSSGHDILLIGRRNKEIEDYQDKAVLNALLTPGEIKDLFDKIKTWMQEI